MLKEYVKLTSVSFTIVTLLNCINMFLFQNKSTISIEIIFWVLGVCMVFNIITLLISRKDFKNVLVRDVILILTLIIIVLSVNTYNGVPLTVLNAIEVSVILILIYYAVVFIMYGKNWADEAKINERIKKGITHGKSNRNK